MRALALIGLLGCGGGRAHEKPRPVEHAAPSYAASGSVDAAVVKAMDAALDASPTLSAACTRYSTAFEKFESCASTTDLPKGVWASAVERNEQVWAADDGPELDRACDAAYKKLLAVAPDFCFRAD